VVGVLGNQNDGTDHYAEHGIPHWNAADGKSLGGFTQKSCAGENGGNEPGGLAVAVSPDGKHVLAAGIYPWTLMVWDYATRKPLPWLKRQGEHSTAYGTIASSPDGKRMAVCGGNWAISDGKVHILDGKTLQPVRTIQAVQQGAHVTAAAWVEDGNRLLVSAWNKTVKLFGLDGKLLEEWPRQKFPWVAMAVSPDGKWLLSGNNTERAATLWDYAKRTAVAKLPTGRSAPWSVAFSHDGKLAATFNGKSILQVWDLKEMKEIGQFDPKLYGGTGNKVLFSPDDKHLYTASDDKHVRKLEI
jgi:WD40 repeat protein